MHDKVEHITLSQAARMAPGRPAANCVWRWCRRGVIARSGERIKLRHVRIGGKIFTTPQWLAEMVGKIKDQKLTSEYYEPETKARIKLQQKLHEGE